MEAGKNGQSVALDAMGVRNATEVLGILRPAPPEDDGRSGPVGLWKAGRGVETECGSPKSHGGRQPVGLWKSGWDGPSGRPA